MKKENITTSTNVRNREAIEALARKLNERMMNVSKCADISADDIIEFVENMEFANPAEHVMPIAATIERSAAYADDHQRQAEMVLEMLKLAKAFHPDLQCHDTAAAYSDTHAFMLALARVMLEINYGVNLHIDNMIYSEAPAALYKAKMMIRDECCRFLRSREFLDYLKENNVAFMDGDDFIIQLLSGSFNVSNEKYEFDRTLTADGICLDPSMKGWDMIIFLMYT